jgi:copper homeostasis protein
MAQSAGAYRIELCSGLSEGGLTPSAGLIEAVREAVSLKVYVLIRPRGGDFLYDEAERRVILSDIRSCGERRCDGVVIGALRREGTVDTSSCAAWVAEAGRYAMGVTFHRAFDRTCDCLRALDDVIGIGCERILTSGGYSSAVEGASVIRQLVERAGKRIAVMPGAGITPENAEGLIRETGAREIHGTFRRRYPSRMVYRNPHLSSREGAYEIGCPDGTGIGKVVAL